MKTSWVRLYVVTTTGQRIQFPELRNGLQTRRVFLAVPVHPPVGGKAERFSRTLQEGWAYRQVFDSNSPGATNVPSQYT